MKNATLKLLTVSFALVFCGAAQANDAPAKPAADAHGGGHDKPAEPAKPAAPAESDLPSKPYPKNAAPFKPKGNTPAVAAAPAPEKPAAAVKPEDKMDKSAALDYAKPAPAKKHKPAAHAAGHAPTAADPAIREVMSDAVKADAHGQSAEREPYKVQARDTLERVIKKTFPTTPFSNEILREAFMKANPQVFANGKSSRLRAGQSLNLPDAAMLRLIILGEVAAKPAAAHPAGAVHGATDAGHEAPKATAAPATAAVEPAALIAVPRQAVVVASSAGQVPEVSAEEKKKWIRFP